MTVRAHIPVFAPSWGDEEITAIMQHLSKDAYITSGKAVDLFERTFGKRFGRYATMTNSGSSALLLAISALDLPAGTPVITPAVTFPTTVSPLLHLKLLPVFVDVCPGTYNIDYELALRAAAQYGAEVAVIPHTLGNPVSSKFFEQFALSVEDACDALGSTYDGRQCGTFGTYSAFSFFGAHHLCTGEGGMVLTSGSNSHDKIRSMNSWGRACECRPGEDDRCGSRLDFQQEDGTYYDHKYSFDFPGFNFKPLEAQGVAGLVQLRKEEWMKARRKKNFETISLYIDSVQDRIVLPTSHKRSDTSWFGFPVTLRKHDRRTVVKNLLAKGIATRPVFAGNIVRHKMMKGRKYEVPFPLTQSDIVYNNSFVVGLGPTVTDSEAHKIGRCLYEEVQE